MHSFLDVPISRWVGRAQAYPAIILLVWLVGFSSVVAAPAPAPPLAPAAGGPGAAQAPAQPRAPAPPQAADAPQAPVGPQGSIGPADAGSHVLDPKASFVLEGMRDARDQLKTGVCTIDFKTEHRDVKNPQFSEDGSAKAVVILGDGGRFRMDWTYPLSVAKSRFLGSPDDLTITPASDERTGFYIRTGDSAIQWFQGQSAISIVQPDSPRPAWVTYFDLKAIGFYSWIELQQGATWESLIANFLKKPLYRVEGPDDHDVYTLTWQLGTEDSEWILTVDAGRGFTPTDAMMRQRASHTDPWRTVQTFKTVWKKTAGVWVPVHSEGRNLQDPSQSTRSVDMSLSWSKVNEALADSLFMYESFKAPAAVAVIDSRLGSPVEIKSGGRSFAVAEPEARPGDGRFMLVVVNVALFLFVGVFLGLRIIRNRRRGHSGGPGAKLSG